MKSGNRRLNVWCGPAHASASAFYAIYNMPRQAVSSWPLLQLINSRAQLTSSRDSYADGRGEPNEGHDPQAALTGTKKATADWVQMPVQGRCLFGMNYLASSINKARDIWRRTTRCYLSLNERSLLCDSFHRIRPQDTAQRPRCHQKIC